MSVCCECCVTSCRGLCDELSTRPEESYRQWCVVVCDLETSWKRRPWPTGGCRAKNKQTKNWRSLSPLPLSFSGVILVLNFFHCLTALVGLGLHIFEVSRSHSDAPFSVGLLWMSDWPVAETSTQQHTTRTTDRHPCPRRDSNSQSQHADGSRPKL